MENGQFSLRFSSRNENTRRRRKEKNQQTHLSIFRHHRSRRCCRCRYTALYCTRCRPSSRSFTRTQRRTRPPCHSRHTSQTRRCIVINRFTCVGLRAALAGADGGSRNGGVVVEIGVDVCGVAGVRWRKMLWGGGEDVR